VFAFGKMSATAQTEMVAGINDLKASDVNAKAGLAQPAKCAATSEGWSPFVACSSSNAIKSL
jgi:hypothetical protein